MIGGLFKSASRLALIAAAGVLVGGVSAQAADLGGDCCADLEERVAELEATTARKGNRKVSLTISGHIHQSIVHWDDGFESNTYAGVNAINSSSRFRFVGEAKIDPKWSAGYMMEIEGNSDVNSDQMNQVDPQGGNYSLTAQATGFAAGSRGRGLTVRQSYWYLDNKDFGRVVIGMTDGAAQGIDGINLANTGNAANQKFGLNMAGFFLRGTQGTQTGAAHLQPNMSSRTWNSVIGANSGMVNLSDETRNNVIKYVSPVMMGFILSAAWGEDDMWDVALRYAGEFSGFKIAAGIGYTQVTDANISPQATPAGGTPNGNSTHFSGCSDLGTLTGAAGLAASRLDRNRDRDCSSWVVGASVMHTATGLFVSGSYSEREDGMRGDLFTARGFVDLAPVDKTDVFWQVRGGIEQNWFGIGKTTLFGEYMEFSGTPINNGDRAAVDAGLHAVLANEAIVKSTASVWGLGIVQAVDAAAMDLYLAYRNHAIDLSSSATGTVVTKVDGVKDLQTITFGGIIRF